jgi:hypothetical protein
MSHRYNTIDIIAEVGMCAIVFGALLFFFAANGTNQAAIPQPISIEQPVGTEFGITHSSRSWAKPWSTRRSSNAGPISSWPNLHPSWTGQPSITKSSNRYRTVPATIWLESSMPWDERL